MLQWIGLLAESSMAFYGENDCIHGNMRIMCKFLFVFFLFNFETKLTLMWLIFE